MELITTFTDRIRSLGPLGVSEGLRPDTIKLKMKAAKMALGSTKIRMLFARQAKYMKDGETYRELPPNHELNVKLKTALIDEIIVNELLLYVQEKRRSVEELSGLLNISPEEVNKNIVKLKKDFADIDNLII